MEKIMETMRARHSVRKYMRPIEEEKRAVLNELVKSCNEESGLNIQIIYDEPECFAAFPVSYGRLTGVENYIALVGSDAADLEERCGYFGEMIVLKAQELGLNTCWAKLTYGKRKCRVKLAAGEKLVCLIALGYGETQGVPHKNKPLEKLCKVVGEKPDWFDIGMEAVMLAPTAVNQQKFMIECVNGKVTAKALQGPCAKIDLGIVKYHFEAVTGCRPQ